MSQPNWGSIIGVVVGFLLGQVAHVTRRLISSRKERRLIRLLVALEINQNLALLRDYWYKLALPPDEETDKARGVTRAPEIEADRLARRAVEIPLPVMSNKALNSQLAVLPKALDEKTIKLTWHVYEQLDQVKALHVWLVEVMSNSSADEDEFPGASRAIRTDGVESMTFKTKKSGAIFELRTTTQRIRELQAKLLLTSTPAPTFAPRRCLAHTSSFVQQHLSVNLTKNAFNVFRPTVGLSAMFWIL